MNIIRVNTPIGIINAYKNDSFAKQLEQLGMYAEQSILDKELKPIIIASEFILDIGGHVGYHSIGYSRINPNAKIITFEAQSRMFTLLDQNVKDNNLQANIIVHNKAVGHEVGQINLSTFITDGPNANTNIEYGTERELNLGGVSIGVNGELVEMITIDSLMLDKIDYIKIDVEGAESLVLLGGEQTIKKHHPVICFEYNHKRLSNEFVNSLGFLELPTPVELLKSWGYTSFIDIPYENIVATF